VAASLPQVLGLFSPSARSTHQLTEQALAASNSEKPNSRKVCMERRKKCSVVVQRAELSTQNIKVSWSLLKRKKKTTTKT